MSAGTPFSSRPSVWLRCRVTLIPLISARSQQGRAVGGGLGGEFATPVSTSTDLGHTSLSACFLSLHLPPCHCLFQCLSLAPSLTFSALFSNYQSHPKSHTNTFCTTTATSTTATTTPSHNPNPSTQSSQEPLYPSSFNNYTSTIHNNNWCSPCPCSPVS